MTPKPEDQSPNAKTPILVSACLLGARCTYDERINSNERLGQISQGRPTLALCPEEIAGLGTPRPASHLTADGPEVLAGRGQVILDGGEDVTDSFISAAHTVLKLCQQHGVTEAYLKSKSPSCGYGPLKINKQASQGQGVTAALLSQHGIKVTSCDADPRQPPQTPPPSTNSFEV